MQPKIYLSCPREKPGNLFTAFYFESGSDIHGWHLEAKDRYFSAAFFMIENFYADHAVHLYRSIEDDVYGPWIIDYPPTRDELIRCPVPESFSHELERQQSRFVEEWLFFKEDPLGGPECLAYASHGLPVAEVNIRWKKIIRLDKQGVQWSYQQGVDPNIIQFLRKYWRLSEKVPAHPARSRLPNARHASARH